MYAYGTSSLLWLIVLRFFLFFAANKSKHTIIIRFYILWRIWICDLQYLSIVIKLFNIFCSSNLSKIAYSIEQTKRKFYLPSRLQSKMKFSRKTYFHSYLARLQFIRWKQNVSFFFQFWWWWKDKTIRRWRPLKTVWRTKIEKEEK